MSLSGLDAGDVNEAYKSAVAEAGGWFLLKYTSRDSVALLGRGKAGVHEARIALAKYEEKSPLYGLIIYRRRKVLIKYIPEGTSRLLQARTAVHFQYILECFSPYETLLELTLPDSLNDTSLAASFPLHTASPSTSSNRLHEISEDGEEHGPRPTMKQTFSSAGSVFGTQRYKSEKRVDQVMGGDRNRRTNPAIRIIDDQTTLSSPAPQKASISQFIVREESGQRSITSLGIQPTKTSVPSYPSSEGSETTATIIEPAVVQIPRTSDRSAEAPDSSGRSIGAVTRSTEPHMITPAHGPLDTARPIGSQGTSGNMHSKLDDDPYDLSRFDFMKPKVKLGPRPVAPGEHSKRTTLSGTAAVPANFRPAPKKAEPSRPRSQDQPKVASQYILQDLPAPPPIPNLPEYSPRPVSRGSIKSLPSHKSTGMTADKLRLMKAVELRKKQMRKSNPQPAFVPPPDEDAPAVPTLPAQTREPMETYQPSGRTQHVTNQALAALEEAQHTNKADSGIEMNYGHMHDHVDDAAEGEVSVQDIEAETASLAAPSNTRPDVQVSHDRVDPASSRRADSPPTVSGASVDDSLERPAENVRTVTQVDMPRASERSEGRVPLALPDSSDQPYSSEEERITEKSGLTNAAPMLSLDMLDDVPAARSSAESPEEPLASHDRTSSFDRSLLQHGNNMNVPSIVVAASTRSVTSASDSSERRSTADADSTEKMSETTSMSPRRNKGDLARRRRGVVEPLNLDGDIASDDEFMEELQSATFQSATPVTMGRSPYAAAFRRTSDSAHSVRSINIRRSSSNLLEAWEADQDLASPPVPVVSSIWRKHASSTPEIERDDPLQLLKRNVSSGITQRIQKLAEVSSREPSPTAVRTPSPDPLQSSAWRERKLSVRSPPKSRTSSMQKLARHSKRLSGSILSRENSNETTPTLNVQAETTGNHNSVSVKARIVRHHSTEPDNDDTQASEGPLQPSELVINHATAIKSQFNKVLPPLNTNTTNSAWDMMPTFVGSAVNASDYRNLHSAHRKSFGRHKANLINMSPMTPSADDFPPPPSQSNMSSTTQRASTVSSNEDTLNHKDTSRTSRFFKRMSNFGGKDRRRSGVQQSGQPYRTDSIDATASAPRSNSQQDRDSPPPVVVGDLNIQFPDSLLWKRRIVEIDETGYLVFSIPQAMDIQKGTTKRFHLSDFKQPYAPDLDRQELPWSVVLEFTAEGGSLQAACEDVMVQKQVLYVLRSYWKIWAGEAN
ncbi:hypothetical protein LTR62_000270 [Meristemomyces frigidus]|uniref:ADF-H domain-containing protein n=1 Tax=Meristemomyces frigidus TaxID=1508187 RepID=A0AAN7TSB5_9PEZI|nr:hypothetical protein LTR62_000270 [Meristemomyces frigidus]